MNYPPTPIPKLTPSSLNPPGLLTPQHSEESEESSSPKLKKVPPKGNILHVSNICPSVRRHLFSLTTSRSSKGYTNYFLPMVPFTRSWLRLSKKGNILLSSIIPKLKMLRRQFKRISCLMSDPKKIPNSSKVESSLSTIAKTQGKIMTEKSKLLLIKPKMLPLPWLRT